MSDIENGPDTRLATYGTLAPGRVNHHQLATLRGSWQRGTVHGRLAEAGWGAALGFPGLVLDSAGPPVDVFVFTSPDLPNHWTRLDEFERQGYRRVVTRVCIVDGREVDASIYVICLLSACLRPGERADEKGHQIRGTPADLGRSACSDV